VTIFTGNILTSAFFLLRISHEKILVINLTRDYISKNQNR